MMTAVMVAMMTPNGDEDNKDNNNKNNDDDDNSSVIAISPHPARVPPKKQRFITQYTTQWEKTSETPSGWAQTNDPIASKCTASQCATQCVTQCSTRCTNHIVELEDDDETGLALCLVSPDTDKQEMVFKSLTDLEGDEADSPPLDLPDLCPLSYSTTFVYI